MTHILFGERGSLFQVTAHRGVNIRYSTVLLVELAGTTTDSSKIKLLLAGTFRGSNEMLEEKLTYYKQITSGESCRSEIGR